MHENVSDGPFVLDAVAYTSVEHYYQSAKYAVGSKEWESILEKETAVDAKKRNTVLKKTIKMRSDFDAEAVMLTALRAKFGQNEDLKTILLSTGDRVLHESGGRQRGGHWDYNGSDRLGQLIMQVRSELAVV
jgi:ribA/ribD-fused uncharacterized protein